MRTALAASSRLTLVVPLVSMLLWQPRCRSRHNHTAGGSPCLRRPPRAVRPRLAFAPTRPPSTQAWQWRHACQCVWSDGAQGSPSATTRTTSSSRSSWRWRCSQTRHQATRAAPLARPPTTDRSLSTRTRSRRCAHTFAAALHPAPPLPIGRRSWAAVWCGRLAVTHTTRPFTPPPQTPSACTQAFGFNLQQWRYLRCGHRYPPLGSGPARDAADDRREFDRLNTLFFSTLDGMEGEVTVVVPRATCSDCQWAQARHGLPYWPSPWVVALPIVPMSPYPRYRWVGSPHERLCDECTASAHGV